MKHGKVKWSALFAGAAMTGLTAGRASASPIAPTNLLIFQEGDATTAASAAGTPLDIQEINPTLTGQTTPVQTFFISTQSSPLFTSSAGSNGILALSNGGQLLTFNGYTASNAVETNVTGRGAGAINAAGQYSQPASYTGAVANQARSAYSQDGVNYYFGDKGGIYYNNGTTPLNAANIRGIKPFGSSTYVLQATANQPVVSVVSPASPSPATTSVTYSGLPGLPAAGDASAVDFVLLSSGNNGAGVPDTLYVTDSTGILKYSFNGTTWTADGSDTALGTKLSGITAVAAGANAVNLYVDSNPSGSGGVLEQVIDSSAYNATLNGSAPVVLYTAPTGALLAGVSVAPVPEPGSAGLLLLGGSLLALRRRRRAAR